MAVHVNHMVSDVVSEAEPTTSASVEKTTWEEVEWLQEMQARVLRNRLRTVAEGFDD